MNTIYVRAYHENMEEALESLQKVIPTYSYMIGDVLYYGEMLNKDFSDYSKLRVGCFSHMTLEGFGNQVTLRSCDLANKLEFDMNMRVVSNIMAVRKVSYCFDIIAGDNIEHSNKFEIVTVGYSLSKVWTDLEWLIDHDWT